MREKDRERFYSYVERGESEDECWAWTGSTMAEGYGKVYVDGKQRGAHRVSYWIHHEEPGDDYVLHHCDTPECTNPRHLYLGDHRQNQQDRSDRNPDSYIKGENHGRSRLTADDVREIRTRAGQDTYMALADEYGVSDTQIMRIVNREQWTHIE